MPRTAPAPNIPAIPGMNPGAFVMGGGGGGGGGSGKGGNGAGGEQGANGEDGGDGANGGGNNSGACGNGDTASCTSCSNTFSAGDPVDALTGAVFTTPKTDLFLKGFFNLEIVRKYSSSRGGVDHGLGANWGFNIDWSFEVGRTAIRVRNGSGLDMYFPLLREDGDVAHWQNWALVRFRDGYILRPGNEFYHHFRRDEDGQIRLFLVSYRKRGVVQFHHEAGRLVRITDTGGRTIVLSRNRQGRLQQLSVPSPDGRQLVFARYEYDHRGDLVQVTDGDGHAWRYRYDDEHRLVEQRFPTGVIFHYRYDTSGRCIETWGQREHGLDPALDPSLPEALVDGTPAKGIMHCKLDYLDEEATTVVDSIRIQRLVHSDSGVGKAVDGSGAVVTRTFDETGRVLSHVDANGTVTEWRHNAVGEVVEEIDGLGQTIAWWRDVEGREVRAVDPAGGQVLMERNLDGDVVSLTDQLGGVSRWRLDDRGMAVEEIDERGEVARFTWDGHGNRTSVRMPSGATTHYQYDYWGRMVSVTAANGEATTFSHDVAGRIVASQDPLGRRWSTTYDGLGNPVSHTRPDGATTTLTWGGLGWLCRVVYADGSEANALFNREGWVTKVVSETGAVHAWSYDGAGRVVGSVTFDGTTRRFELDPRGRPVWVEDARGKTHYERNAIGQIVKVIAPDESERQLEYDERSELVAIVSGSSRIHIRRDATGAVVGESHLFGGEATHVETERDPTGRRAILRSSLGHEAEFLRDGDGRVREVRSGGAQVVGFSHTPLGDVGTWHLPEGGQVVDHHDAVGRVRRRQVLGTDPEPSEGPDRLSIFEGQADRHYDYTPVDEVSMVKSLHDGTIAYDYDVRGHLTAKTTDDVSERWQADANANYRRTDEGGEPRAYATGDRLQVMGDTRYAYDDDGFLIAKHRKTGAGAEETTRYHWDGWRNLSAVDLPDGRRVEFDYDGFNRRIAKRMLRDDLVVTSTRWVWDGQRPLHETVMDGATGAETTQTFVYRDEGDHVPVAQRSDARSRWEYLVPDLIGAPEDIVDGRGRLLAHLERDTFGRVRLDARAGASTSFRYPGQLDDPEIGLHYNRHRYYDPDAGRYISPDPIGLEGGHNFYAYGVNPIAWIDPYGLAHGVYIRQSDVPGMTAGEEYSSGYDSFDDSFFQTQSRAHSERAVLARLQDIRTQGEAAGRGNVLRGRNVTMRGEKPPCVNCHRAMHAFAQQNQMGSIRYEFPADTGASSVTYSSGQPPRFGGPASTDMLTLRNGSQMTLEQAYQLQGSNIRERDTRNVNRERGRIGGAGYQSWGNAQQAYTAHNAGGVHPKASSS